jgi:polyribonucleotide nucleotidyltransferase
VLPGKDGMVHISELADFRVKRTEDVVIVGDVIWVKCIGVDDKGRVKLSRKAAMKERDEATQASAGGEAPAPAALAAPAPPAAVEPRFETQL